MTSPHDPLARLRPEITPLAAPDGAHQEVLRRAARRRVRTASIVASGAAVVALVVAVPLVVVAGGTDEQVAQPAPPTSPLLTPAPTTVVPAPAAPTATVPPVTTAPPPSDDGRPTGPVPRGFAPQSVTFISTRDGWTLGQAPCTKQPCTSVARTSDGGASWVGTAAPRTGDVLGSAVTSGVDQLRFGSPTDGWAFGGELWSTHDGDHWDAVPLPAGQAAVSLAANSTRVVAGLGVGCGTSGACTQTVLRSAASGGDAFTPLPGASTVPGRAAVTLSGSTVWALSVDGGTTRLVRGAADGSSDVAALPTPCTQNADRARMAASTRTDLVLACTTTGSTDVQVFASKDAGGSWARTGSATLPGALTAVAAAPGTVLLSDDAGGVQRSTDGGASFGTVLAGSGFSFVGLTSSSQGVALPATPGVADLRITRDGGTSWQTLDVS
ncbi:hypothetical protein RHODO2019_17875 [Rhodococcus antarcticus]|uniref:Exo-alpha-sialidase n=1 Tax=Rhodococcus antarcticus TaxID=2987751 RepID=A0ABY6P0Q2_9NOCA|nr:hypothetical protein [Rhodococcus antarcticus]UZJ24936.1 hypothetical protein RHODO2019_17875 [Rhodococcus antarcticus]